MAIGRSRQDWLALFETTLCNPACEMNEHWCLLLRELRLPASHYLALVEALRQGRWRTADDPKAYVKRVVRIEASKMEASERDPSLHFIPDDPENEDKGGISALLDRNVLADTYSEPMRSTDGVWRPIDQYQWYGDSDYEEDENGNRIETYRDHLLAKIPGTLKQTKAPTQETIDLYGFLNEGQKEHHYNAKPSVHSGLEGVGQAGGAGCLGTQGFEVSSGRRQPGSSLNQADQRSLKKGASGSLEELRQDRERPAEGLSRKSSRANVPE